MKISQEGIKLIKEFEGFSKEPYICPAEKLTIGYGHVVKKSEEPLAKFCNIFEEKATELLKQDLKAIEAYLNNNLYFFLNSYQFDALCSLLYNWGIRNFSCSKGFKALKEGDKALAAEEFFSREKGVVNIAGEFSEGLYRRRQKELELWNYV